MTTKDEYILKYVNTINTLLLIQDLTNDENKEQADEIRQSIKKMHQAFNASAIHEIESGNTFIPQAIQQLKESNQTSIEFLSNDDDIQFLKDDMEMMISFIDGMDVHESSELTSDLAREEFHTMFLTQCNYLSQSRVIITLLRNQANMEIIEQWRNKLKIMENDVADDIEAIKKVSIEDAIYLTVPQTYSMISSLVKHSDEYSKEDIRDQVIFILKLNGYHNMPEADYERQITKGMFILKQKQLPMKQIEQEFSKLLK